MRRIGTADRDVDKHGAGKDGFTDGTPGVTAATAVDANWFDAVQEEIANAVEVFGATALNPATNNQLSTVLAASYDGIKQQSWAWTGDHTVVDRDAIQYATQRLVVVRVPLPPVAYSDGSMTWSGSSAGPSVRSEANSAYMYIPLDGALFDGCEIGGFSVYVQAGASRATVGNRITVDVVAQLASTGALEDLSSDYTDNGTMTGQGIGPGSGLGITVAKNSRSYYLRVRSGNDGGTNRDRVYAASVFLLVQKFLP